MNVIELSGALRQLRLGGMAAVLETRLHQVQTEPMPPIDFLSCLVMDELNRRGDRLLERRKKQAAFRDPQKTLEAFDRRWPVLRWPLRWDTLRLSSSKLYGDCPLFRRGRKGPFPTGDYIKRRSRRGEATHRLFASSGTLRITQLNSVDFSTIESISPQPSHRGVLLGAERFSLCFRGPQAP
jgi:hypothetical protein